jgi:septum formation protein
MSKKLVLASQSPRRKQLLEWAEVPFEIVVVPTDETFPPGTGMGEAAIHIARQKALAVRNQVGPGRVILAADTIVVLDGEPIGKPADRDDAVSILARLSGRTHEVITGVVLNGPGFEQAFFDRTEVQFHSLTREQLEYYVDQYKPYDKAGAYAIQEWIGVVGIHSINGDFYNVMGLPVSRVVQALRNIQFL